MYLEAVAGGRLSAGTCRRSRHWRWCDRETAVRTTRLCLFGTAYLVFPGSWFWLLMWVLPIAYFLRCLAWTRPPRWRLKLGSPVQRSKIVSFQTPLRVSDWFLPPLDAC